MAKTQYSFTTDPNLRGAPTGHMPVREVRLSPGPASSWRSAARS
jgi:formate--tetrahydrofolate ligase